MVTLMSTANHEGRRIRFVLTSCVFLVHLSPVTGPADATCTGAGGIEVMWFEQERPSETFPQSGDQSTAGDTGHTRSFPCKPLAFSGSTGTIKNGEVTASWPHSSDPSYDGNNQYSF